VAGSKIRNLLSSFNFAFKDTKSNFSSPTRPACFTSDQKVCVLNDRIPTGSYCVYNLVPTTQFTIDYNYQIITATTSIHLAHNLKDLVIEVSYSIRREVRKRMMEMYKSGRPSGALALRCCIHRESNAFLLPNGSIHSHFTTAKVVKHLGALQCIFMLDSTDEDELVFAGDGLIINCSFKTSEALISSMYYQTDFMPRKVYCEMDGCDYTMYFNWVADPSYYYYSKWGSNEPTVPIDFQFHLNTNIFPNVINSISGTNILFSIDKLVVLSSFEIYSQRLTVHNFVRMVSDIFKVVIDKLKVDTCGLVPNDQSDQLKDELHIVVQCHEKGTFSFSSNAYYHSTRSFEKHQWIEKNLNQKIFLRSLALAKYLSLQGPVLSFSIVIKLESSFE